MKEIGLVKISGNIIFVIATNLEAKLVNGPIFMKVDFEGNYLAWMVHIIENEP